MTKKSILARHDEEEDLLVFTKDFLNDLERQKPEWHLKRLSIATQEEARHASVNLEIVHNRLANALRVLRMIEALLKSPDTGPTKDLPWKKPIEN